MRTELCFHLAVVSALLPAVALAAPAPPADPDSGILPGSHLPLAEALDRSDLVVLAEMTKLLGGARISGMGIHYRARVRVVRPLRGELVSGELEMALKVSAGRDRTPPRVGREYVFIVDRLSPEQLQCLKVLVPTGSVIRQVEGHVKVRPCFEP